MYYARVCSEPLVFFVHCFTGICFTQWQACVPSYLTLKELCSVLIGLVMCFISFSQHTVSTVELHLSGLIGTASHPDMQKIWIIGFFFESRIRRQFTLRLLLFTVCTCV